MAAAPDPKRLFDLSVELPWLRVSHIARVEQPHQEGRLVIETRVSSRGWWQLLLGPIIAIARLVVSSGHQTWVRRLAEHLTRLPVTGFPFGEDRAGEPAVKTAHDPDFSTGAALNLAGLDTSFLATPFSTLAWLRRTASGDSSN